MLSNKFILGNNGKMKTQVISIKINDGPFFEKYRYFMIGMLSDKHLKKNLPSTKNNLIFFTHYTLVVILCLQKNKVVF